LYNDLYNTFRDELRCGVSQRVASQGSQWALTREVPFDIHHERFSAAFIGRFPAAFTREVHIGFHHGFHSGLRRPLSPAWRLFSPVRFIGPYRDRTGKIE
jgi:hypothetical protein